jgi:hypothetical protein
LIQAGKGCTGNIRPASAKPSSILPGAIASVSQQQLRFVEGMEDLDTVEAFTEKPDGGLV